MKRNHFTYTVQELKKMSTSRLIDVFFYMHGYYIDSFDRYVILNKIANRCEEYRRFKMSQEERIKEDNERKERMRKQHIENMKIMKSWFDTKTDNLGNGDRKMDSLVVKQIRSLHNNGVGYSTIAKMFNKQPNYIRNICIRKIYKDVD